MGQPITVVVKPSSTPGIIRYETNRAITGMGHERYASLSDIVDDRPVDELARRVIEHGGVDSLHVNGNVITVRLAGGSTGDGLDEVIGGLYLFYTDDDDDVDGTVDAADPTESADSPDTPDAPDTPDPVDSAEPEPADGKDSGGA